MLVEEWKPRAEKLYFWIDTSNTTLIQRNESFSTGFSFMASKISAAPKLAAPERSGRLFKLSKK